MSAGAAVIFDLGKVLLDFDYSVVIRRLAEAGSVTEQQVRRTLLETALLYDYESGRLDSVAFHRRVQSALGLELDYASFREQFGDIFTPIPQMIEAHAIVRGRGFSTFIFSNTNEIAIAHIRKQYPFFGDFDGYVFSYQVGAMKPAEAIYASMEQEAGRVRADLFYLDDRPENVEAARARGWRGHVHTDAPSSLTALRDAGFVA
jgi:HAD superfamily hydrolase (TIGR01509 family)